ncbi:protein of unknown function [Candidatus Methylomirabilis oxygeniifera]|uniref:Uncharacterized protein n=1 Tax=Methylomirabilis oxygeniifera TaxID=671143 RepID=D5MLC7_METO1|nr:protein of unknown function [Candidatus Methylomirabilis oxyfera]
MRPDGCEPLCRLGLGHWSNHRGADLSVTNLEPCESTEGSFLAACREFVYPESQTGFRVKHGMTGQNSRGTGERSDERARLAAVDGDACAGHEAGLLGRQEDHGGRDLLGAAESAQRQFVFDELGDLSRVFALSSVPRATRKESRAGCHAVDQDIVRSQFLGERLGEADHRRLGGVVGHRPSRLPSPDRGDG